MATELEVSGAQAADAALLLELLRRAFSEYEGKLDPPSGANGETIESLARKLGAGGAYVCRRNGVAVGCIFFEPKADHLYVGRLSVVPEFRGRGIGDVLLRATEEHAVRIRLPSVRLGVRIVLEVLRTYYAARGYMPIALHSHAGYTHPTFVEMEKRLR